MSVALVSAPAIAQDAAEEAPAETIVVTGSRIASATQTSPAPLQIVDTQAIQDSGITNIQELLLENPAFGTPTLSRTNSAFLTSGTGVATVDLRDLGSNRTLTLVNGRRVVGSLAGTSTVDLNAIPTQFLERVDILTGGASSLYGSDAIAGVVNFVYKSDFQGIELNGQYGVTSRGDDPRYQMNATIGTNFADGDGNIMVHFGYSKEEGLLSRERRNTQVDDISLINFTGDPADWGTGVTFFSSFPPQGRFITDGGTFTYDENGNLKAGFSTSGPDLDGDGFGDGDPGADGFNRQNFRTIAVPVERYLFAASGSYAIADDINFFFEGTFNRTSSSRIIEPFPLESGGANGIYPTGGGYNVENYLPGTTTIVANPFVPDEILAAAVDNNGDGLRDIGFVRRLSEFGNRTGSTDRDFYRFVVGFDGTLFDDRFRWDVSYNFGQVNENQISSGQVNVVNFRDALAVRAEDGDENGNGIFGEAICIDAEARANGCQAANIFGFGSLSQGAVDYIQAQGTFQTGITQQVFQGNISGSLFDLPAGPVGIAVGVEYRKESSFSDNDALTNQGLNAGNVLPDTRGSFDVKEGFVELRVPILADTPFFKLLEVGGAVRIADYSTVGSVTSWNVTGTWQPIEDLRIRGTYARAVRAPNIGELFAGRSQTFPAGLQDPCVGIGATGGGAVGDNCRADPGVAANIADNDVFTLNQADIQGISGFNGGNPDLFEETAKSFTVGAVLNPRSIDALRNLSLTVDYYNIKIEDVISGFPRQFSLDQCYGQGNDTFCDLIVRRAAPTAVNSAGSIDLINAFQVNAAVLKTSGIDATAAWNTGLGLIENDRLSMRVAYTHLLRNDFFALPTVDADPSDGEIGTAKDRFTANLAYMTDDFRVSFTGTYIGKSYEDDGFCAAFDLDPKCISVPAQFYLDMQSTFYASDSAEIYFGIDNLLDNDAPNILSGTTFNTTGTDTAADVYDVFGRRFYVGARLRF
jgi:outer membrane receptor protein involved in Fe transport